MAGTSPYDATTGLSRSLGEPYDATGAVIRAIAVVWSALQGITSIRELPWDATAAAGFVAATFVLAYDAQGLVNRALQLPLSALQIITRGAGDPFDAPQGIGRAIGEPFESLSIGGRQLALVWTALQAIARVAGASPYDVAQGLRRPLVLPWDTQLGGFEICAAVLIAGDVVTFVHLIDSAGVAVLIGDSPTTLVLTDDGC